MNGFDRQLWKRFLSIAQPYFYPIEPHSSSTFLGLLLLLIAFMFSMMFVGISLVSLGGQAAFPNFFNSIAPGLADWVTGILNSSWGIVLGLMLVIPAVGFLYYRRQLMPRWQTWAILTLLLFLSLSVSLLNVVISYVANFFTTALAEKDQSSFWRFLFVYAGVFVVGTPIVVIYRYIRDKLGLYWRDWMTQKFLNQYFQNRSYYEINTDDEIDNPDQRITEDIRSFTQTSLRFLLLILGAIFDVIAFTGILWSISKNLSIFLVFYAAIGTVITVIISRRLIPLNFQQLRREADFRYGLVHVRDNAESIAFYRGEEPESLQVKHRFLEVFRNFNLLIGWQRNVDYFTTSYDYAVIILPALILAPLYFAGGIKYGNITQADFAFRQVLGAFSLVVDQITAISAFAAGINRLATFSESLKPSTLIPMSERRTIDTVIGSELSLEHLTLHTPKHNKILIKDISVKVQPNTGLLIVGQSGAGKSSLLRAIAGLWTSGTGCLVRPDLKEMMFLPQRPYMILGTLRAQLLYPNTLSDVHARELEPILKQALDLVNLADLPDRVGGLDAELQWNNILSLGEQQRLAFARLLLAQPRYAILDEATSALDLKNEERLYKRLQMTKTTFISVGHRPSLLQYHHQVLELVGDSTWRLTTTQDYCADASLFA